MMRTLLLALLAWFIIAVPQSSAGDTTQEHTRQDFAKTPVLHGGRVKPIDSYARILLREFHGSETLDSLSASQWLLEIITNPPQAITRPLFTIKNPEIISFLEINQDKISAKDLSIAFARHKKNINELEKADFQTLTPAQKETLELYSKLLLFTSLLQGKELPLAEKANPFLITLEYYYINAKPYNYSLGLYALAALLGIAALGRPQNKSLLQIASIAGFAALLLAAMIHTSAIMARIIILQRPPVGTLYESVLFVSLICAAVTLIMLIRRPSPPALTAGALTSLFLLGIAPASLTHTESLEPLAAVLNTNFWLFLHVLTITIGYGLCIMTGTLAHIAIFKRYENLYTPLYIMSLISLLFTATGTILGGIWADQSWGRFWGWDPKENGALLIVLWLIWLHHGRLSGHIKPLGFLTGLCTLNIIVALAWFGVNLLGVGLHTYGFTQGLATGLFTFCAAECILIASLILFNLKRAR